MSNTLRRSVALLAGCVLAWVGSVTPARAQATIAVQYAFQDAGGTGTTVPTINNTSVVLDATAATTLGGTSAAFVALAGSTDPDAASQVWEITNFPAAGTGNLTGGVRFRTPTSSAAGGFNNLIVRLDHRHDATASRFFQLQYTTDGTNFVNAGTYEAYINNTFFTRTLDLSGVAAANNNPNFAVRALAQFAPGTTDYAPTTPGATYAPASPNQFDMVTVQRGLRWQGGSGPNLGTAANWQGGAAPGAGDAVLFGASANTAVTVAASQSLGPIVFQAGAPSYTLSAAAGQTLTVAAGITNNSTNVQTITAPLTFSTFQTIQNTGTLVLGDLTIAAAQQVSVVGAGTTAINGTVSTGARVNFGSGQTLAGIGTFGVEPYIYNGKVRGGVPGGPNARGTLTLNNVDLETFAAPGNQGTIFQVDTLRTGPNAADHSKIVVTGQDLELNGANTGGNLWGIEILGSNLVPGETYTVQVVTTPTGGIEENNTVRGDGYIFNPTTYTLTSPHFSAFSFQELRVTSNLVGAGTDTLVLSFTPVPEPTSIFLLCAAATAGGAWMRRRFSGPA